MAFRRFNALFRRLNNKDLKHWHSLYNHHQCSLFTSRYNSISNRHRQHIFHTPYSNQINRIYSQCYNIIYNQIKRQYHLHQSSSFYNLYRTKSHHHLNSNNNSYYHYIFKRFASMDVSKDYYKILGVNKNATKKEIRASYLKLAKKWHPDLHKNEKDKESARDKFIEVQEAYEVLHDDPMRKKYDEMRRYGVSQDQYKYQEAYRRQSQQGFTQHRGANPYESAWEQEFRRNMQQEWEKIRREQQEWASARRQERHKYADQFPFGSPHTRGGGGFGSTPFGFGPPGGSPFDGNQPINPLEGFFRSMLYVFAFFMAVRLIGFILFGPSRERRGRSGYDPFGDPYYNKKRGESPYYKPSEYNKYNHAFPPPLSLRQKHKYNNNNDDGDDDDEYDRNNDRKLRRGSYQPPPPSMTGGPKPRNSLKDDRGGRGNESGLEEDDGNKYTFSTPSSQQTQTQNMKKNMKKKKKSKYERMLEEQRMMEEVYIRARRKQMEEQEYERQRDINKKFGRMKGMPPPPPTQRRRGDKDETEDANEAWERYLNSKSGNEMNWRDRGRKNS